MPLCVVRSQNKGFLTSNNTKYYYYWRQKRRKRFKYKWKYFIRQQHLCVEFHWEEVVVSISKGVGNLQLEKASNEWWWRRCVIEAAKTFAAAAASATMAFWQLLLAVLACRGLAPAAALAGGGGGAVKAVRLITPPDYWKAFLNISYLDPERNVWHTERAEIGRYRNGKKKRTFPTFPC